MNQIKNFRRNRRPSESNLHQLLIEYDQKCHELKRHQSVIAEDLLRFNLLKPANLYNFNQDHNI